MMIMFTAMMMVMSGIIFLQMNHPMAMGLMLLIQTLLTCLITGMMNKSFWMSYILFLVFLGGMLILFIYVTAIASNEMFYMSMNKMMYIMTTMFLIMMVTFSNDMLMIYPINESLDTSTLMNTKSFHPENSINLMKLYNYPTVSITIMMMNYLLITLIAVVKITNVFYGPLRKTY